MKGAQNEDSILLRLNATFHKSNLFLNKILNYFMIFATYFQINWKSNKYDLNCPKLWNIWLMSEYGNGTKMK